MQLPALCKACGLPFMRVVDKGTPKQYCSRLCRDEVKRSRYLANREKRRQAQEQAHTQSISDTCCKGDGVMCGMWEQMR